MTTGLRFTQNSASPQHLYVHLQSCDNAFIPPLGERVAVAEYAEKLHGNSERFEGWSDTDLIGLVAAYINKSSQGSAFISNVSVVTEFHGQGVATTLICRCFEWMKAKEIRSVYLDVSSKNIPALNLYQKWRFKAVGEDNSNIKMMLDLT